MGSLGLSPLPTVWPRAALGGWLWAQLFRSRATSSSPKLLYLVGDGAGSCLAGNGGSGWVLSPTCPSTPSSLPCPPLPPFTGSSTVDLLIYQTLCYTRDELRGVDVGDFVLKPCGLEEFLQK